MRLTHILAVLTAAPVAAAVEICQYFLVSFLKHSSLSLLYHSSCYTPNPNGTEKT